MVQRTATYPASTRPSASTPAADWVTRFVDEERQREQFRRRDARTAAARADEARKHLTELMESLREHITRDVDAFDRQLLDRVVTAVATDELADDAASSSVADATRRHVSRSNCIPRTRPSTSITSLPPRPGSSRRPCARSS